MNFWTFGFSEPWATLLAASFHRPLPGLVPFPPFLSTNTCIDPASPSLRIHNGAALDNDDDINDDADGVSDTTGQRVPRKAWPAAQLPVPSWTTHLRPAMDPLQLVPAY